MRTPLALLVSALVAVAAALSACAPEAGEDTGQATGGEAAVDTRPSPAEAFEDPEVGRIWSRMLDTIAPDDGWAETRYVQFDWIVGRGDGEPLRRSHRWDVWEGRYRVEAPMGDDTMVAIFDVDDPTGSERIWLDGEPVTDPARADSLAERANAMFINDSYWLLMPFKWADEGVTATYLGEMEEWGETYEVVELTFDEVGLTPQNKYRAFVDPETGVMELWQHYREASDTVPSFTMAWTDWERYGPVVLSTGRVDQEGAPRIWFENVDAAREVPAGAFEPPEGAEPPGGGA